MFCCINTTICCICDADKHFVSIDKMTITKCIPLETKTINNSEEFLLNAPLCSLSEKTDIDPAAWWHYLRGNRSISEPVLQRIGKAFNLTKGKVLDLIDLRRSCPIDNRFNSRRTKKPNQKTKPNHDR